MGGDSIMDAVWEIKLETTPVLIGLFEKSVKTIFVRSGLFIIESEQINARYRTSEMESKLNQTQCD